MKPMTEADRKADRQERKKEAARAEIKAAAWTQVAERGAASLSLRAVAAAIGLSAPALYRYFPSRDSLVTALVIDAYGSLARAQERTYEDMAAESWEAILRGLGHAYRNWALGQPAAFYMIFGAPIPGYVLPTEETTPAAAGSLSALIRTLGLAKEHGGLAMPIQPAPSPELRAAFESWSDAVHQADPEILYLAVSIASRVQGLALAELGGQFAPYLPDFSPIFDRELGRIVAEIKRRPS